MIFKLFKPRCGNVPIHTSFKNFCSCLSSLRWKLQLHWYCLVSYTKKKLHRLRNFKSYFLKVCFLAMYWFAKSEKIVSLSLLRFFENTVFKVTAHRTKRKKSNFLHLNEEKKGKEKHFRPTLIHAYTSEKKWLCWRILFKYNSHLT